MDIIYTCFINLYSEKQLIRNDINPSEEYWVAVEDIPTTLYWLNTEKNVKKIYFEGPYPDCEDLIRKYSNIYPNNKIIFAIN